MFTAREIWEAGRIALGLSEKSSQEKTDPARPGTQTDPAPVIQPDLPQKSSPNLYLDAPAPKAPEPRPAVPAEASAAEVFDPSMYDFQPGAYRIHFRNGCSGEYDGVVLAQQFPFDPHEVVDVRPVEEVGQG